MKKKIVAMLGIMAMLVGLIAPIGNVRAEEKTPDEIIESSLVKKRGRNASDTVSYVIGEQINYGGAFTNVFGGTVNGNYGEIYCMNPLKVAPVSGSYAVSYLDNSTALAKAMYYLYGGAGFVRDELIGGTDNDMRIATHMVVAYILDPNGDWSAGVSGGLLNGVQNIANALPNYATPPSSFKAYVFNMGQSTQAMIGSYNVPQGKLTLKKESANPNITDGNRCYSLKGAVYDVMDSSKTVVGQLVTDENGKTNTLSLDVGSYTVKEKTAPKGYALDPNTYSVSIKSNQEAVVNGGTVKDTPQNDPVRMWVGKIDLETTLDMPQGSASLAGAEFTLKYYDVVYGASDKDIDPATKGETPLRTWVVKTNENGMALLDDDFLVSGNELFKDTYGKTTLPRGTVTAQETKAPNGYLINDDSVHVRQILTDGSALEAVETYDTPIIKEQVKRGDLEFIKIEDGTNQRMGGVPFEIVSLTTGEKHVIVTDKNGYGSTASSNNLHSDNTNRGEKSTDGIWFGELSALDDEKGALIYDDYEINELECEANQGKKLLTDIRVTIEKDNTVVKMGTLTNDEKPVPKIGTKLTTEDGKKIVVKKGIIKLPDTIEYVDFDDYIGEEVTANGVLTADGNEVTVDGKNIVGTAKFKPISGSGEAVVMFEFDVSKLDDETLTKLTAYETVLDSKGNVIAEHKDPNDEGQTIELTDKPAIGTKLTTEDGKKEIVENGVIKLPDTIEYVGFEDYVGEEVTAKGVLTADGKEVTVDGKNIVGTTKFKPISGSGEAVVTFEFDVSKLDDKTLTKLTAFETVLDSKGNVIAEHKDPNDEGQTVKLPKLEEPVVKQPTVHTGDKAFPIVLIVLFVASAGVLFVFRKKFEKKESDDIGEVLLDEEDERSR
ncbi:outer membrane protein OmpA-like peptidoglycan-associated protein [Lachnospiraceae bacterium PH1-22]